MGESCTGSNVCAPLKPLCPLGAVIRYHGTSRYDITRGKQKVFAWFESKPIASGSIAQIHKAILNGEVVAVKVRFVTESVFQSCMCAVGRFPGSCSDWRSFGTIWFSQS